MHDKLVSNYRGQVDGKQPMNFMTEKGNLQRTGLDNMHLPITQILLQKINNHRSHLIKIHVLSLNILHSSFLPNQIYATFMNKPYKLQLSYNKIRSWSQIINYPKININKSADQWNIMRWSIGEWNFGSFCFQSDFTISLKILNSLFSSLFHNIPQFSVQNVTKYKKLLKH